MNVFFYGLFMDTQLLAAKGIVPAHMESGFVDGYALRIGERATMVVRPEARTYGVVMQITSEEADRLYSEDSVADYQPVSIVVDLRNGTRIDAICYVLPADKISGTNTDYAEALLGVATRLDFPASYLSEIRKKAASY